jgi:SRC kinase signaling inhibitor 1
MESPTSPNLPPRGADQQMSNVNNNNNAKINNNNNYNNQYLQNDQDSGSESNNSQDNNSQRQLQLEMRHQELLKKQKQLQEQYQRLQQISKNSIPLAPGDDTRQTGSDTNLSADKANDNVAMPQTFITTNKVYETDIL